MDYSAIRFQGEEIKHYGVLGMKWGVRKNPSKAYYKARKKKDRLEKKSVGLNLKSAKIRSKALKKSAKATNEKQYQKARKLEFKANKLAILSAKYQRKGLKWTKSMEKVFRDYDVRALSSSEIAAGKKYFYSVTKKKDRG